MMKTRVLVLADIHGSFKPVRELYKAHKQELDQTNNILILLGDAGLNFFFNHRDIEFKRQLGKYPFTYFVIRGNHEERASICAHNHPDEWVLESFWNGYVHTEIEYPYIKYAMDGVSIYDVAYDAETSPKTARTLVIPGAYSVDKYHRIEKNWSWFPQEQLSKDEMIKGWNLIEGNPTFDLVLSHTCPICYEPTDLFLSTVDQSMVDKTMERYLGYIEYRIKYKLFLWGHYHQLRVYPKYNNQQCIMLYNDHALDLEDWLDKDEYTFVDF